ncbi:NAD(P)H-binding protein [Lacticaseibacillus hulanensis]|uniref:NAD(P)H-binding protein n=1 Tax=Lacticaseibacillus hulanensis TaxID=2493111 RepID=UPI000FDA5657|nr:NAD(P)H-binding protein [Lacticaseibacillus hulanensis]
MKIAIIGASGMAGSALYQEATKRGHEVTGFARNIAHARTVLGENANIVQRDGFTLTRVQLQNFDVVIDAISAPANKAYLHIDLAAHLIHELRNTTKPYLAFITGAGSLISDGHPFVQDLAKAPGSENFISIPRSQAAELEFLRHVDNVRWTAVSPAASFVAGPATDFVLGQDDLLRNANGDSVLNSGTMAVALLNEVEQPEHEYTRFTLRNK